MYVWLFRQLPGPLWLRILLSVVILAGVLLLLVEVVFPWLADVTNLTDATVGFVNFGFANFGFVNSGFVNFGSAMVS